MTQPRSLVALACLASLIVPSARALAQAEPAAVPTSPPPLQGAPLNEPPPPPLPESAPAPADAPTSAGAPTTTSPLSVMPADVPPSPPLPEEQPAEPPSSSGAMIDGHLREGPFLSGPGSLTFVLHHSLLAATGGLVTQGISNNFNLEQAGREAMFAGTLIGAGLGFATSAWWQFNHWIGWSAANFGIINSIASGMFFAGAAALFTQDPLAISWTSFLGAELGAWLTITLGGGDLPMSQGLLVASGAGWAMAYGALLMAIIRTSGTKVNNDTTAKVILLAPGFGAGLMALATLRYNPTSMQILRADAFGAGVGGAVLLLASAVLWNFNTPTPYVLSLLSSAGAIAAVSLLWEEAAERPRALYRDPEKDRPYRSVWW